MYLYLHTHIKFFFYCSFRGVSGGRKIMFLIHLYPEIEILSFTVESEVNLEIFLAFEQMYKRTKELFMKDSTFY